MLKKELNLELTNDKIKFLNEIAKILAKVSNQMEREIYIEKISKDYQISKEAIQAEVNKIMYANSPGAKKLEKQVYTYTASQIKQTNEISKDVLKRENMVIYLLMNEPEKAYIKFKDIIACENFQDKLNQQILKKLYEEHEKGNSNINQILDQLEDEAIIGHLTEIMAYDFEITDVDKAIEDLIITYKREGLVQRRNEILKQLENGGEDNMSQLENELNDIILKLAKMK